MLLIKQKIDHQSDQFQQVTVSGQLTLPFEIRQKARFLAKLDCGKEVGLQIERGHILRGGDRLLAEDGSAIEVKAANEAVSTIKTQDQKLLARVCYHLGNRHVQLQVEEGWCRYLEDHVLDEMVELLGAAVNHEQAPFEPEAGAYAGGHHHHHSNHSHDDHESSHVHLKDELMSTS